jgi:hypothetical protein
MAALPDHSAPARRLPRLARWVALAACACGGGQPEAADPTDKVGPSVGPIETFLPLESGTVMAYDTIDEETGEKGMVVLRIDRPRPERAELSDSGRVQRFEISEDGVSHITGGYLLKLPLAQGAEFRGRFGRVKITRTDLGVEVPAGKFESCIETVEQNAAATKRATTVFCPHVGMVSLQVEGTVEGEYARIGFVLRSHGPAVDIGAIAPEPDDTEK